LQAAEIGLWETGWCILRALRAGSDVETLPVPATDIKYQVWRKKNEEEEEEEENRLPLSRADSLRILLAGTDFQGCVG
jgi:hypothetical protein